MQSDLELTGHVVDRRSFVDAARRSRTSRRWQVLSFALAHEVSTPVLARFGPSRSDLELTGHGVDQSTVAQLDGRIRLDGGKSSSRRAAPSPFVRWLGPVTARTVTVVVGVSGIRAYDLPIDKLHERGVGAERDLFGALPRAAKRGQSLCEERIAGLLDGLRIHGVSAQSSRTGSSPELS